MHTLLFRRYNWLTRKTVHTNLHTVSTNQVNRSHNHYGNSYEKVMTIIRKTKWDINWMDIAVVPPTWMLGMGDWNEVLMDIFRKCLWILKNNTFYETLGKNYWLSTLTSRNHLFKCSLQFAYAFFLVIVISIKANVDIFYQIKKTFIHFSNPVQNDLSWDILQ